MTMQDPIADMFTRIRNGLSAAKRKVSLDSSKSKVAIANLLKTEGYINGFEVEGEIKKTITVDLKYFEEKPVIRTIKRISRPSLRIYKGAKDFPKASGGLGIIIVSTSKGFMTATSAEKQGLGGEVIGLVD